MISSTYVIFNNVSYKLAQNIIHTIIKDLIIKTFSGVKFN